VHQVLDDELAVTVDGYWFSDAYKNGTWDGKHRFYYARTGRFLAGLLDQVLSLLDKHFPDQYVEVVDNRSAPFVQPPYKKSAISLRPYQKEAVQKILECKNCVLHAATNSGKTEVAIELIRRLGLPTTYIVHRKELMYQTAERMREKLNIKIGMIGDGICELEDVTIVMPKSVITSTYDPISRSRLKHMKKGLETLLSNQVMFLDECHNLKDSYINWFVRHSNSYYRFAMSGTPFMNDVVTNRELIGLFGETAYHISNMDLIKLHISSEPTCFFYKMESTEVFDMDYETSYKMNIVENTERNRAITRMVKKFNSVNLNVLILVREIVHGATLQAMFGAPFIHGSLSSEVRQNAIKRFKASKGKSLIASTILDEGVDIANIDVLILAAGGKSPKRLLQRIGRGLRKKESNRLLVIDFLDTADEYTLNHSIQRADTVKAEGFRTKLLKPSDLDNF